MVSINEFQKLDLRVGEVISADPVEGSDKLFVLQVDIGGRQAQLVAGLKGHYTADEMVGKKIIVVANLDPAKIRGIESQGMLLAALDGSTISLLTLDKDASVGSKVM
ncbi:MAG: methionine--tRNA ligase subunit beta [Candidatus Aenigmatarchaeota archaeon]|nr:MAG: methionine--tRNA ligase subunit beta [Candidatus Aenigmarchaeota archaeon]